MNDGAEDVQIKQPILLRIKRRREEKCVDSLLLAPFSKRQASSPLGLRFCRLVDTVHAGDLENADHVKDSVWRLKHAHTRFPAAAPSLDIRLQESLEEKLLAASQHNEIRRQIDVHALHYKECGRNVHQLDDGSRVLMVDISAKTGPPEHVTASQKQVAEECHSDRKRHYDAISPVCRVGGFEYDVYAVDSDPTLAVMSPLEYGDHILRTLEVDGVAVAEVKSEDIFVVMDSDAASEESASFSKCTISDYPDEESGVTTESSSSVEAWEYEENLTHPELTSPTCDDCGRPDDEIDKYWNSLEREGRPRRSREGQKAKNVNSGGSDSDAVFHWDATSPSSVPDGSMTSLSECQRRKQLEENVGCAVMEDDSARSVMLRLQALEKMEKEWNEQGKKKELKTGIDSYIRHVVR